MARNGSGIYIPPNGNPVSSGTVISSAWANTLVGDLGNEITNSLPRDGTAPMSGVLKLVDGSVSSPALTFLTETGTGFFRRGPNDIVLSVGGVARAAFTPTGFNAVNLGETTRGTAKVTTFDANGAVTLGSTLAVTGNATFAGTLAVAGAVTFTVGATGITKAQVGLANAENTADLAKPISTAVQAALDAMFELAAPAGAVEFFAMSTPPSGWLKANGAAVSRTTFARLFAKIGTTWGVGDNTTTFNLPDLRGEFLRGWDDAKGTDVGRVFASAQASDNKSHGHVVNDPSHQHVGGFTGDAGYHGHTIRDPGHSHQLGVTPGNGINYAGTGGNPSPAYGNTAGAGTGIQVVEAGQHSHSLTTTWSPTGISLQLTGITESRPTNRALLACIRF